jgi:hypothetical protein
MASPSSDKDPAPAEIFAEWLAHHELGDEKEFARLLHEHPAQAADLECARADWQLAQHTLARISHQRERVTAASA